MEDLIKALQIFLKYRNVSYPTICVHDVLIITGYSKDEISEEDKIELDKLGFFWMEEFESWASYKYGSA